MPVSASAQKDAEVEEARKLFVEAAHDEEARRLDVAYAKFLRVQQVRDTFRVRVHLGTCLEGLGRTAGALSAYHAALDLAGDDPSQAAAIEHVRERIATLSKVVPKITLAFPEGAPADAIVRVDESPVPASELDQPILVDPGSHTITAVASGSEPFRVIVVLTDGGQLTVPVTLAPMRPPPPPPSQVPPARDLDASPSRAPWIATAAGGGTLVAASVILFIAQQRDIETLNRRCPNGTCPANEDRAELEAIRERAALEGPLGVGLGIAGLAAVGLGAYMLTRPDGTSTRGHARVAPIVHRQGASLVVSAEF